MHLKERIRKVFTGQHKPIQDPVYLFPLFDLPNDILVCLAPFLSYDALYNLIRTNRRFYHLLLIPLYKRFLDNNLRLNVVDTLACASLTLNTGTLRNLIRVGAPLHLLTGTRYNHTRASLYLKSHTAHNVPDTGPVEMFIPIGSGRKPTILLSAALEGNSKVVNMIATASHLVHPQDTHGRPSEIVFKVVLPSNTMRLPDTDQCCRNVLHLACINRERFRLTNDFEGRTRAVLLVRDYMRNINSRDLNECTPLHYAVQDGWDFMIRLLLRAGAKVNARNRAGVSALHMAARVEDIKTALSACHILVGFKADKTIMIPSSGRTAYDIALSRRSKAGQLHRIDEIRTRRLLKLLRCT
ncbi:ankyrin repeat-containing domain protein [Morchella snyderi]|nr:ankyrin repeat-containing domain protein [Morchella snyderi]